MISSSFVKTALGDILKQGDIPFRDPEDLITKLPSEEFYLLKMFMSLSNTGASTPHKAVWFGEASLPAVMWSEREWWLIMWVRLARVCRVLLPVIISSHS